MSFSLLLPFLMAAVLLVLAARATLYRPRYRFEEVVRLVRKLEILDLLALFDPGEDWAIRTLCGKKEFRAMQRERLRQAREYLRRIGHNAEVIQTWAGALYEDIRLKPREDFTPQDFLIWEVLELATEVRVYHLSAVVKITVWTLLRAHSWPKRWRPHLSSLPIFGEGNLVKKYRALVETSTSLSRTYGQGHYEQLMAAL
jgi:hypothetical protein